MRSTGKQPRTGDLWLRFLIFSLAALLLMALQLTGQLQALRSAISVITSPAQLGSTSLGKSVTDGVNTLLELRTLRQRVSELEEINASLRAELFRLNEVERENEAMRRLLEFGQTRPGLDLRGAQIIARVIGQESTNFLEYIEVNLGADQGIEVGMPVLTEQGLVGRVEEVNRVTAKVLLITDPSSNVTAILQSSRLDGVLRGDVSGNLFMDTILQGAEFSVGEVVLTSGIGLNFPRSIPIGRVIERRQRDIDIFQQAIIRPIIDFSHLELVAIVTNFDPLETGPTIEPSNTENGDDAASNAENNDSEGGASPSETDESPLLLPTPVANP